MSEMNYWDEYLDFINGHQNSSLGAFNKFLEKHEISYSDYNNAISEYRNEETLVPFRDAFHTVITQLVFNKQFKDLIK